MARHTEPTEHDAAPEAFSGPALRLPEELTIYTVGELHPQWLSWLETLPAEALAVQLQGNTVDQVDGAGLQMLLSLTRSLTTRGVSTLLHEPSTALQEGCTAMGMGPWLQERSVGQAGVAA